MANKVRGEVEVELGGKRYTLRPSFEAMAEAESILGYGVVKVATRFIRGEHGVREVAAMLYAGMVGSGAREMSFNEVGAAVVKAGLGNLSKPASQFAFEMLKGDEEAEEEKKE